MKHEQGKNISAISREMNVSRNTVYKYLKIKEPPSHRRPSRFDAFRPLVSDLLKSNKGANEIERICRHEGYTGSRSTLNKMVAQEIRNAPAPTKSVRRSKILTRLWKAADPNESDVSLEESWTEKQPVLMELQLLALSFRRIFKEKKNPCLTNG
ncbi:helix-turn-helix domain-containing protein [Thalassobacillus sp. C254]|uniref:helix-turn-helix domain-containing protein n=1 Tax=Thalassobacillus sp. C254 TaxID=1225341 RepID=UPI0006D2B291